MSWVWDVTSFGRWHSCSSALVSVIMPTLPLQVSFTANRSLCYTAACSIHGQQDVCHAWSIEGVFRWVRKKNFPCFIQQIVTPHLKQQKHINQYVWIKSLEFNHLHREHFSIHFWCQVRSNIKLIDFTFWNIHFRLCGLFVPGRYLPAGEGGSQGSLCPQLCTLSTAAGS